MRAASRYERGVPAKSTTEVVASNDRSICVPSPAPMVATFAVTPRRASSRVRAVRSMIAVVDSSLTRRLELKPERGAASSRTIRASCEGVGASANAHPPPRVAGSGIGSVNSTGTCASWTAVANASS